MGETWVRQQRETGKGRRRKSKWIGIHPTSASHRSVFLQAGRPSCRPTNSVKKGSPYSITECRFPVLGSQPAGDVSHIPGGRLPLLSARPAVTPATLKRAATNFAAW